MDWAIEYWPYIVAVMLAISELLAVTPQLKGNGILDSLIKILSKAKNAGA